MNELQTNENKDIIYSSFILKKNGLEAIGTPTFEQWQECGEFIRKAEGAVHFWIGDWLNYGESKYGETYAQAIDHTGYDYQTVANDKWLSNKIELSDRSENLGVRHAQLIASLPEGDKKFWAEEIKREKIPVRELKEKIKARKKASLPKPTIPEGVFSVLYADPPWDIGSMVLDKWESPLEDKYPTMTPEELRGMKIPEMADDSVCFMWTTLSTLPQALELLAWWGFKYHVTITWDKGNGFSMSGFHRKTELCIFGYRGVLSNVVKQEGEYIPTVFYEAKTTHSTKPEAMYKFIEDRTIGPKIELFARTNREGWQSWGNQLNGSN